MRQTLLMVILSLALFSCSNDVVERSYDPKKDEAAIRKVISAYEKAVNKGDVAGYMKLFAADAVIMPPGNPSLDTGPGFKKMLEESFTRFHMKIRITTCEIRVENDIAYVLNDLEGTLSVLEDSNGDPVELREILIFRRQPAGEWKIFRQMTNDRNPAIPEENY